MRTTLTKSNEKFTPIFVTNDEIRPSKQGNFHYIKSKKILMNLLNIFQIIKEILKSP